MPQRRIKCEVGRVRNLGDLEQCQSTIAWVHPEYIDALRLALVGTARSSSRKRVGAYIDEPRLRGGRFAEAVGRVRRGQIRCGGQGNRSSEQREKLATR